MMLYLYRVPHRVFGTDTRRYAGFHQCRIPFVMAVAVMTILTRLEGPLRIESHFAYLTQLLAVMSRGPHLSLSLANRVVGHTNGLILTSRRPGVTDLEWCSKGVGRGA